MKELGVNNVIVKELSFWKFLFTKERDVFDWKRLKEWIEGVRKPSEENLVVKRKVIVEVRGLSLNVWSENNLKKVVKDLGI